MPLTRSGWALVLAAAALLLGGAAPASAHQGNPLFRSVIRRIVPAVPGLEIRVLDFDNQFELDNKTGKTVVIYGYSGDQYARLLPDGTVQLNHLSPATYLNEDRYGNVPVPSYANPKAPPQWQTIDETGVFVWHDHRMHWLSYETPPQVKDSSRKTKIFNYTIPMRVGGKPVKLLGTLYWTGSPSGFPTVALIALILVAVLAVLTVVLVRRRRAGGGAESEGPDGGGEAW
jgi:hypothetical protein